MQAIENQVTLKEQLPENWEKQEEAYSDDALIDAYLRGKQAGRNDAWRILLKQLHENINTATSVSERLYSEVSKMDFHLNSIHIKADGISKFSALFLTNKEDFLSDRFREAYVLARKIKREVESDDFYISFSFMPSSETVIESCLAADGYFMKYGKK